MDKLTKFERELLAQFKVMASEFEQSQAASESYLKKVAAWSKAISGRQAEIETEQDRMMQIMRAQNEQLKELLQQLNALQMLSTG